jgi:hypothetical protein
MNKFDVFVSRVHGHAKPFQLCIQEHSEDLSTRLEHEDFHVTSDDLVALRNEIDRALTEVPESE